LIDRARPSALDDQVFAFDIAQIAQACSQYLDSRPRGRVAEAQESETRNLSTGMRHGVREFTVAGSAHSSRRTGSVNVNVEPCPAWLFTQIRPPWSSMNFRES